MKKLIIILISLVSITACKKKDTSPDASTSNTTGGGPAATGVQGLFTTEKFQTISNGTISTTSSNSSYAYVSNYNLVQSGYIAGSLFDLGNVSLNGVTFKKNYWNADNSYKDSTVASSYNPPLNWTVSGSPAISSFSFSSNNPYPSYNGYNAIPDSFDISSNISIPLTGVIDADEIQYYFERTSPSYTNTTIQTISASSTSLTFNTNDLATIGNSSNVYLVVSLYKNDVQVINGRKYNFRIGQTYFKYYLKFY